MSTGYNWRNTLADFARTSGVLAGFSITFIALMLRGGIADIQIGVTTMTFGQVAVLLFGVSSSLFIAASQYFLQSKEYDVFSVPQRYIEVLKANCKIEKKDWKKFEDEQTEQCKAKEKIGRDFYNYAIIIMFVGLFFSIVPYSFLVAFVVSGLGIAFEVWQMGKWKIFRSHVS